MLPLSVGGGVVVTSEETKIYKGLPLNMVASTWDDIYIFHGVPPWTHSCHTGRQIILQGVPLWGHSCHIG